MTKSQKLSLFLLRVSIGWLFLYAGLSKLMKGNWSAAGYLNSAKTFPDLYHWFASPGILPVINFLNEYGQILIGISLILGILVRYSTTSASSRPTSPCTPCHKTLPSIAIATIVDEHVI